METLILNEYKKSAQDVFAYTTTLGPSYNESIKNELNQFFIEGLPNKKNEDWIYTNISKNLSPRFFANETQFKSVDPQFICDPQSVIIFNNGHFNQMDSLLPEGLEFDQLTLSNEFFDAFDRLNYSVATTPLFLKLNKNVVLNNPLTIIHQVDEAAVNKVVSPRIKIKCEPFSKITIIEIFTSTQNSLLQYTTNASTQFDLMENSNVEHVIIQNEAKSSVHIGLSKANILNHSKFHSMTIDLGQLTSRHNIEANLSAPGAEAHVNGLFSLNKSEHADIFSHIHHLKGQNQSSQLFKGIMNDESHGAFTGKITIDQDAQLVSSEQLNKNLMLSKKSHIDTRPQLLVAADDVKCSHGATIGQLSEDESFYLESRGISKQKAKEMQCFGFALDVLMKIENKMAFHFSEKMLMHHFKNQSTEKLV